MAELIWRLRAATRPRPGARGADLWWLVLVGGAAVVVLGWLVTVSVPAACALALLVAVLAVHEHDRRAGIAALFALWFVAPALRRILGHLTGYVANDPLSLVPFLATAAIAAVELGRIHIPARPRRIILLAAAGFAIGLPVGLLTTPQSAVYAFIAYMAAVSGAVLGFCDRGTLQESTLRRVLVYGVPLVAAYALAQRLFPLPSWDREWLETTTLTSLGTGENQKIRVFSTLNSPGALAPLLALSLLCLITTTRARAATVAGALVVTVALSLTFVRSTWVALIVAGLAHVIASRGRSARPVLGAFAVAAAATVALSPVSATARDVMNRFETIGGAQEDASTTERRVTFSATFPQAVRAPLGHGLGSAGEATKLSEDDSLRAPDNGYLSLVYQVGPIGALLVLTALALVLRAAWDGARARAPGQDLRVLLFAMLVMFLVLLTAGDEFYGSHGVLLWFICGQVLAFDARRRLTAAPPPVSDG
jgi:hypothetical protein